METKDVILELRTKKGLSQDELAEKVYVTRQAVSRWENGETIPNTETLKLLSGFFDVSINTLLGSPRQLICQCCGMPLDDSTISKEPDGTFNEEYCKWCYTDGKFTYDNIDDLIAFCVEHTQGLDYARKEDMHFISMIRLPDFVTKEDFEWAVQEATKKKKQDFSKVEFFPYDEGMCVQCMHIGSYDDEPATVDLMHDYMKANGYGLDITDTRYHHEIYLSDPRKCDVSRLKTVVRHPIRKAE